MQENNPLLRGIPRVDTLTEAVRAELDSLRADIQAGTTTQLPDEQTLCSRVLSRMQSDARASLRPVINATGVILHTNLGRACLSQQAANAAAAVALSYSTLEYNPSAGKRGSRHTHVQSLLCALTGASAAMVVNNNAAAVLLILSAVANTREVILSRGEMVEIGGSFRIPDVMLQSGAILREVGTTNKTRLSDYKNAISPLTGAILKVHPSNYRISGFSQSTPLAELCELGHAHNLPVIEDAGSGALVPPALFGAPDEPYIPASIAAGADLVCFSGDKLVGGPQAGLIVGDAKLIEQCKQHPLARALRVDKLTLAALEATLRTYLDPAQAISELPTLAMLSISPDALRQKSEHLLHILGDLPHASCEIISEQAQTGGGCIPCIPLPSWAIAITPHNMRAHELEHLLRAAEPPIVARISKQRLLLDVRTIFPQDFPHIAAVLVAQLCK